MLNKLHIPIKYKFLFVLLVIMLSSLTAFFYFAQKTFSEDKKLFVMDLNLTLLKAATSEIQLELKGRIEELAVLVPRLYQWNPKIAAGQVDPLAGLSERLADDLIQVRIFKKVNGTFEQTNVFRNVPVLEKQGLDESFFGEIDRRTALQLGAGFTSDSMEMRNRSIRISTKQGSLGIPILTVQLGGNFIDNASKEVVVVVDLIQDFLRKKLQQSEIAELFLISKKGFLLAHSSLGPIVDYANVPFPHPIVQRLANKQFPRESLELDVNGEAYLLNVSETGFPGVFAVSQIRKSEAFHQLNELLHQSVLLALLILSIAIIFSTVFASGLTANIQKLKEAAEQIGNGHLKTKIHIESNDEVQSVAQSFQWMSDRLGQLINETAQKARMEDELATARLVQSTILTTPAIRSTAVDLASHYVPASECGGDFWDAHLQGNKLTVFIGDATGHGAPAAIVTAVAKSCFTTLSSIYASSDALSPEQILGTMNQVIHSSCKGQLLVTMCLIQIDLSTGELLLSNAGHESPMCLKANSAPAAGKSNKAKAEVFFARGERLGFNPGSVYETVRHQLTPGDTVLLYTDGISEARDLNRKEWGERSLKKAFSAQGTRSVSELKTQIVTALEDHSRGATQDDDITFVLVTWNAAMPQETLPSTPEAVWEKGAAPNLQRKLTTVIVEEEPVAPAPRVSGSRVNDIPVPEALWQEEVVISDEEQQEDPTKTDIGKGPKAA